MLSSLTFLLLPSAAVLAGVTKPFPRSEASPDLSLEHAQLQRSQNAPVEQVHLTGGGAGDPVLVNFATATAMESCVQYLRLDGHSALEVVNAVGSGSAWMTATGVSDLYSSLNAYTPMDSRGRPHFSRTRRGAYNNASDVYTSPMLHTVELRDLVPGGLYAYRVPPSAETFFFRAPREVDPQASVTFGLVADLGQTLDSLATLENMKARYMVLFVGDLSYADGFGPRWDSFGRMAQPFFSGMVTAAVGGNHEIVEGESWVGLRMRWPAPRRGTGARAPLFYSFETGPVHVIALNTYVGASQDSEMYRFVENDLQSIDRSRTPWVIGMWHTPWYTSSTVHKMSEAAEMRQSMEDLMFRAGIDLIFHGHVHAYERTLPVYKEAVAECGGVYINIGDGGNREGVADRWLDPQPSWSAFREASFGFGTLEIRGGESAVWRWFRNVDGDGVKPAEEITFTRSTSCTAQRF